MRQLDTLHVRAHMAYPDIHWKRRRAKATVGDAWSCSSGSQAAPTNQWQSASSWSGWCTDDSPWQWWSDWSTEKPPETAWHDWNWNNADWWWADHWHGYVQDEERSQKKYARWDRHATTQPEADANLMEDANQTNVNQKEDANQSNVNKTQCWSCGAWCLQENLRHLPECKCRPRCTGFAQGYLVWRQLTMHGLTSAKSSMTWNKV